MLIANLTKEINANAQKSNVVISLCRENEHLLPQKIAVETLLKTSFPNSLHSALLDYQVNFPSKLGRYCYITFAASTQRKLIF